MKVKSVINIIDPIPKELEIRLTSEPLEASELFKLLDEYDIRWEITIREYEAEPGDNVIVEKCTFAGEYNDGLNAER